MSRIGRDFAPLFPALVRALEKLPEDTIIDGEIVALTAAGRPSFNLLQNYQTAAQTIVFYAFDLLVLSGRNLTDMPLQERRELLQTRVMRRLREPIRFSETLNAPLDRVLEGVLVIGGYTVGGRTLRRDSGRLL